MQSMTFVDVLGSLPTLAVALLSFRIYCWLYLYEQYTNDHKIYRTCKLYISQKIELTNSVCIYTLGRRYVGFVLVGRIGGLAAVGDSGLLRGSERGSNLQC